MDAHETAEEVLKSVKDTSNCKIRAVRDQGVLVCYITIRGQYTSVEEWQLLLPQITRFLHTIRDTQEKFHFTFDLSELEHLPLERLSDLQALLYEDVKILTHNLYSSVIILSASSQFVRLLLATTFQIYRPLRPIGLFTKSTDVETAREMISFFRANRDMAIRRPPPL